MTREEMKARVRSLAVATFKAVCKDHLAVEGDIREEIFEDFDREMFAAYHLNDGSLKDQIAMEGDEAKNLIADLCDKLMAAIDQM